MNNALNHWKGVSQFMELADSQGTMNRVWGLDLPSASEYRKSFEKMAAELAPERTGADQSGKVSLAFTPEGKGGLEIVQQTRRTGTETKVGDFATSGHETLTLDKSLRDAQDVTKEGSLRESLDKTVVDKEHVYKAGQLISDGTTIDEKRAFQMALKGNQVMLSH